MFGPWYCPKIDNYTLQGQIGFTLFMSVQKCTNFIERTGKGNVTTDCELDEDIEKYVTGNV